MCVGVCVCVVMGHQTEVTAHRPSVALVALTNTNFTGHSFYIGFLTGLLTLAVQGERMSKYTGVTLKQTSKRLRESLKTMACSDSEICL